MFASFEENVSDICLWEITANASVLQCFDCQCVAIRVQKLSPRVFWLVSRVFFPSFFFLLLLLLDLLYHLMIMTYVM